LVCRSYKRQKDSELEILALLAIYGPFFFVGASFTGGFAGAIAAGGREDRTIVANSGIGFVGWLAAWATTSILSGSPPEEITLVHVALAIFWSVVFIGLVLDREDSSKLNVRNGRHGRV